MEILPELYPLTGLQIGDIQAYVSWAFLYFAAGSNRVLVLVDNRPWLMNNSKPARLWQLMVTKYRMSPFTNTRSLQKTSNTNGGKNGNNDGHKRNHTKSKRFSQWFSVIDSVKWQKKYFLPAIDLSKALHGFIVFEVAWKDVHGINYLSELQKVSILLADRHDTCSGSEIHDKVGILQP